MGEFPQGEFPSTPGDGGEQTADSGSAGDPGFEDSAGGPPSEPSFEETSGGAEGSEGGAQTEDLTWRGTHLFRLTRHLPENTFAL